MQSGGKPYSPERKGIDGAIRVIRWSLGLWEYHIKVSDILKTQTYRVADAIGKFDSPTGTHVNKVNTNGATIAYTTLNARALWLQYVRTRTTAVIDAQTLFMDNYFAKVQKYQAANSASMSQAQKDRITALGIAIAAKSAWVNPI